MLGDEPSVPHYTLQERAPLELSDVDLLVKMNEQYERLVDAVSPAIVSIDTAGVRTEQLRDMWGRARLRQYPTQGQGSGVIVTREGHVITNHHVIDGQQQIRVTLEGGKTYRATPIGHDSILDIAILKIEGSGPFIPLKFADSSEVEVGQMVFAFGNPFGLGETVTQGIISAKERSLSDNQRDFFQTDAAINPGNSGGPLVNVRGEIIGINVAIFSTDRQNPSFSGVGFSIPANDVRDTMMQILDRGRPMRGYLGLQMHEMDATVRAALQYRGPSGVVVVGLIPGSPAIDAGIAPWDVIEAYEGVAIESMSQFITMVQKTALGSTVRLRVWRSGEILEIRATVIGSEDGARAERNAKIDRKTSQVEHLEGVIESVGMRVRGLHPAEQLGGRGGVVVLGVQESKQAADFFKPGDQILAVNHVRIRSVDDFLILISTSLQSRPTSIHFLRDRQPFQVMMQPPEIHGK